jgi:hypothetical protein
MLATPLLLSSVYRFLRDAWIRTQRAYCRDKIMRATNLFAPPPPPLTQVCVTFCPVIVTLNPLIVNLGLLHARGGWVGSRQVHGLWFTVYPGWGGEKERCI